MLRGLGSGAGGVGIAAESAPRPAGELATRSGRAADDGGDVVEGELEHVMKYERRAFGRRQPLRHHLQRQAHGVGERRPFGRIELLHAGGEVAKPWPVRRHVARMLASSPGRTQLVEAQPADNGRQPRPHIVELATRDTRRSRARCRSTLIRC
jgi:hypothetical protein